MKKLSKVEGRISLRSVVFPNGMAFKAEKELYFGSISTLAAETRVDGDEVKTESVNEIHVDETFEDRIASIAKKVRIFSVPLLVISFLLWSIAMSSHSPLELVCRVLLVVSASAIAAPRSITRFVLRIFKKGEYLEESRFRGALYQVINAFYDLGKVPKLEELKDYSIFSRYDPYFTRELNGPVVFVAAGLLMNLNWIAYLVGLAMIIIVLFALMKTNMIYAMEFLVVAKPTKMHQEVAILTLKEAVSYVDAIKVSKIIISSPLDEIPDELIDMEDCEKCSEAENCILYQMVKKQETQS